MTLEKFKGTLLEGHKGAAVEVPFDPKNRWDVDQMQLWEGRRGFRIRGTVNGVAFESAIVGRSKKHWLLVDDETQTAAKAQVGDLVAVVLEPVFADE